MPERLTLLSRRCLVLDVLWIVGGIGACGLLVFMLLAIFAGLWAIHPLLGMLFAMATLGLIPAAGAVEDRMR